MMQKFTRKLQMLKYAAERRLIPNKGEGYVDTLIKILIAVVLGALILGLLVALVNAVFPELQAKIMEMFNGTSTTSVTSTTP